jgi:hypothetical protein
VRRTLSVAAALALLAVSCDASIDTTTTTVDTTTTTAAATVGRIPLEPNGPPIASPGERGAYVEAIQFYLVCVGLAQPDPERPQVSIDGSFGPITAFAAAYYQAQLQRVPSGAPDDETFASMARECPDDRTLAFPIGESTVEIAGNAAPGDDETYGFAGLNGQALRLTAVDGTVSIVVLDGAGEEVGSGTGSVDVELPTAGAYAIRISADTATTYRLIAEVRSPNVLVSEFGPMVLQADGTGVAEFGGEPENAIAVMGLLLGVPFEDSGWRDDVAACPGTHRVVTWLIQAGLDTDQHPAVFTAYFAEVSSVPSFLEYAYFTLDMQALDPLAQGLGTAGGASIGTTLEQFLALEDYEDVTLGSGGTATVDDGVVITFAVSGGDTPDPLLTRVRRIESGSGGCDSL